MSPRQAPNDQGTSVLSPAIQAAIANVDPNVVNAVIQVAQQKGIDPNLALAVMMVESGGNPRSTGDGGTSFGLFQLHQGGELGNLSASQAFDPYTNATVALSVFQSVMQAHPGTNPGVLAALSQRPADAQGYANRVNQVLGGAAGSVPATGGGQVDPGVQTAQTGTSSPYLNPINSAEWGTARTDQGVDYIPKNPNTPVNAIGNATVVYSSMNSGWPGGAFIAYRLNDGPMAGKLVYVAEHLTNLVPVGTQVKAGQQIALAQPGYPWTEWGWASGNGAGVLTPYGSAPDGTQTGGGKAFARFLVSLGASVLEDPGPGPLYPGGPAGADPGTGGGGTAGGAAGGPGSAPTWNGQPLTMADIPQVDDYIRSNWGTMAWLLDVPSVKQTLEQGAVNGWSPDQTEAKIEQSPWWQTTSQAMRTYEADKFQNPGDYTFTVAGSKASIALTHIMDMAAKNGVTLSTVQAQQIALNSLMYGWSDEQTQAAVGAQVNAATGGNAQQVMQTINGAAGEQFQKLTPQVAASWAQNIAGGTQTIEQFKAQMAADAAAKWTGYGAQLQQGMTMSQLTSSLRQNASSTMEVDPSTIDFVNNPMYSKILDYVPPNSPNGVHRVMTQSEADAYLKTQPQWGSTQQARTQSSTLADSILQAFGKTGQ